MKFDVELVGKVGSMALVNKAWGDIDYNAIARISRELKAGYIWVSSGATEIGRIDYIRRNGCEIDGDYSEVKVDYAAQGQTILMNNYRQFIDPKYSVRQILVEHRHFNNPAKKENLKKLLLRCPIINYNDPLSSEEIDKVELQELAKSRKDVVHCMDNDETASQIACLVKCKTLLIYTSTLGIYSDPADEKTLIRNITGKDSYELINAVCDAQSKCIGSSRVGANGAVAKLEYIKEPLKNGSEVFIANPRFSISEVIGGQAPCTKIFISK